MARHEADAVVDLARADQRDESSRRVGHRSVHDRRTASGDDGAEDFSASLAELGLSQKTGWYSSAVLYGVGGSLVTALSIVAPHLVPRGVAVLSGFAIVVAALCLVGGRLASERDGAIRWATHLRLIVGLTIYATSAVLLGNKVVAFAPLPLLTIPTPCYLYSWRFALPYCGAAVLIVFVALMSVAGPARTAHAIVSSAAFIV